MTDSACSHFTVCIKWPNTGYLDWQNLRIATTFAKKITKFLEKAEIRAKIAQVEIAIEDYTLAIDQVPNIEVFQRKLSCI